ncbi:hypothetical protein Tco_0007895 [Tanacetum coccineum]
MSTICSKYEIGESSTARPVRGQGIDYGFVSTVDAEERRQGIRDVGITSRRTAELHERDTQDLYALLEDAQDSRSRISQRVEMNSHWIESGNPSELPDPSDQCMHMRPIASTGTPTTRLITAAEYSHSDTAPETLRVIRDMRREMSDMQAELGSTARAAKDTRQSNQRQGFRRSPGGFWGTPTYHLVIYVLYFARQIMAPTTRGGPNTPINNTNPNNMTPESIQAMIDQALLRNATNGDGSHSSHGDNRRNVQTARLVFTLIS